MTDPARLDGPTLAALFPARRPQPIKPGVFELGLCLGGTVSAGAYTGGVLDYLFEALDAWARAKEDKDPLAPPHEVVISTLAGTSGGAINGAIALRAAGWEFQHGSSPDNPFFTAWTDGVDLMKLLAAGDGGGLASVLNCASIDAQAAQTIAYASKDLGTSTSPHFRSYLADPLRLFMMVGNVTGVPYTIPLKGETGLTHGLMSHADYVRFALGVRNGVVNPPSSRPDEFALASRDALNWDLLGKASLATSAFPLAFRSRPLSRKLEAFGYRAIAVPTEDGTSDVRQLIPKWEILRGGGAGATGVDFVNVDGGAMNNEPLDVVRTTLAGLDGRNKRKPSEVDRAVILIDPFSDPDTLGPQIPPSVPDLVLPFVLSLINQARYKPVDIALANDEDAYSRYLIAPVGPDYTGKNRAIGQAAIASGGLGGFIGFVDPSFLKYDYALGRYNAYWFLRKHLVLPVSAQNRIHDGWTPDQRREHRYEENGVEYLPIIPLMKRLRDAEKTLEPPAWPKLAAMPGGLQAAIEARLDALYAEAKSEVLPDTWWKRALGSSYLWLGWKFYVRGAARDFALDTIRAALVKQHLL